LQADGIEVLEVEDANWKLSAKGGEGETCSVTLQSNAAIANYPFTTLMPNLGVMTTDDFSRDARQQNVLVDLPGLIEGAHQGRGLGRMFLRHLARTQMLVHVLDGAAEDPAADYWVVREELRMFNPAYCRRPCLVVVNKMDLPDASDLRVRTRLLLRPLVLSRRRCHLVRCAVAGDDGVEEWTSSPTGFLGWDSCLWV